eukprot:TRINITY_DN2045_c0_g2_i1.p1 TRINITY_DN2045_c0_g2~~TRINITY_DN2045_c0_g2_i1.p1  ORF type:complete len:334 (-),score=62.62 TRINITY_DN2045_c0_g2_i1:133-1134(-)
MGKNSTCSVTNCKTGYRSIKTTSTDFKPARHSFPTNEEMRNKWIAAIPNGKSINVNNAIVCSLHFTSEDYRTQGLTCGQNLELRLLKRTAVPSIFPRRDPALNLPKAIRRKNESSLRSEEMIQLNNVTCVKELRERIPNFGMPSHILMESKGGILTFIHVQRGRTGAPVISFSLCVNLDMTFEMYLKDKPLPPSVVSHALTSNRIQTCSQVVNILASLENLMDSSFIDGPPKVNANDKDPLKYIQVLVGEILDALQGVSEEVTKSLRFLMEDALQVLTPCKARRYSSYILSLATEWEKMSPVLYKHLSEENILALPSTRYLKQLKAKDGGTKE